MKDERMNVGGWMWEPENLECAARILEAGAQLLEDTGWCVGAYARNGEGEGVGPDSQDAVAFCAAGAIIRACRQMKGEGKVFPYGEWTHAERWWQQRYFHTLTAFNDRCTTREQVVGKLREAAADARMALEGLLGK